MWYEDKILEAKEYLFSPVTHSGKYVLSTHVWWLRASG